MLTSPDNSAGTQINNGDSHLAITARVTDQLIGLGEDTQVIKVIEVGTSNIDRGLSSFVKNIDEAGMTTLDQLFCPFIINLDWSTDAVLPSWSEPITSGEVTATKLNPFNPDLIMTDPSTLYSRGPNLGFYGNDIDTGPSATGDFYQYGNLRRNGSGSFSKIKSVGFKAPMVITGWGYDTDDKPVPADTGNPDVFASGAFRDPSLWKSGPLDVRWDASRGVWAAGTSTKVFLSKVTNTYNPSNFSYEVERSSSRDQFSRVGPTIRRDFNTADPIYDPEQIAYDADENNVGAYEKLDYTGLEFPHYEAFILRQTSDDVGPSYYNIWTEDCSDCGHTSNPCPSGTSTQNGDASAGKKILIENPLKQSLEAGDLCFTVKTGRTKNVNTGSFVGGSGVGASGYITTNSSGVAAFVVSNSGSGYIYGGFALISSGICVGVTPSFTSGMLSSATVVPASGLPRNRTYQVSVYPLNSTAETEALDVHWIMQAEFKTTQVATYVGCDGGVLQTCSRKIQTQGMVSCEYCGTSTALINSF